MGFWNQLKLLIWKNYTLRKRQKIKQLIELLWPLTIFAILVLVRTKSPPLNYHECHFNGKAMPSAGLIPFVRSFLCYNNNTCHQYPTAAETSNVVQEATSGSLSEWFLNVEKLLTVGVELENLLKFDDVIPNGPLRVSDIVSDPERFKEILTQQFGLSPSVVDSLLQVSLTTEQINELQEGEVQNVLCSQSVLDQLDSAARDQVQDQLCNSALPDPGDLRDIFDAAAPLLGLVPLLGSTLGDSSGAQIPSGLDALLPSLSGLDTSAFEGSPAGLFSNAGQVSQLFDDLNLTPDVESWLFQSGNLFQGLDTITDVDELRGIVCNTSSLQQYLVPSLTPADLEETSTELCALNDTQLEEILNFLNNNSISNLLGNNTCSNITQMLMTELELFEELQMAAGQLANISEAGDLYTSVCGTTADDFSLVSVLLAITQNLSSNSNSTGGPSSNVEQLYENSYQEYLVPDESYVYQYDNSTTPFCNEMFERIESSRFTRMLWRYLKPFVLGKILYTPDNTFTKKVIEKANWAFQALEDLETLSNQWLVASPQLRSLLIALSSNTSLSNGVFSYLEEECNLNTSSFNRSSFYSSDVRNALDIMDTTTTFLSEYLQCAVLDKFEPVSSEDELVKLGLKLSEDDKLWAGVVFMNTENYSAYSVDSTHYIEYKIRMISEFVESSKRLQDRFWVPRPRANIAYDMKYLMSGFVYIQDMIEEGLIQVLSGQESSPDTGIYIQQFPYPCYIDDGFVFMLSIILPLFMVVSWEFSVAMIIKSIVYEKEKRLKEVMKTMGLSNGVHWMAWFINALVMMLISVILLIVILKFGGLIPRSDITVLFFFMFSFCVSLISLSFLISVFFSQANLAAACGGIIYFLTYVPFVFLVTWDPYLNQSIRLFMSLFNMIAFSYGCLFFSIYEVNGEGIQWSNIAKTPFLDQYEYTFSHSILMMWVDTFIYAILTWYIEAVFPGQYGMPKVWYFPFTKSYWFGNSGPQNISVDAGELGFSNPNYDDISPPTPTTEHHLSSSNSNPDMEANPNHLPLGVSIHNLVKVYKNTDKRAVDGLSLNFYEGQITSFLGHNGAGKTTTMSILTGLFPPTHGTAFIYGKDIKSESDEIRKSLGMCPQHNVLFDLLTVEEHLWFYARLKGVKEEELGHEIEQMINDVGLPHKRREPSRNLSGGMKRKLSVAVAFVGGSRTVILDEPTAGVDPYARRSIWDLLTKYRKGRTIILTTHHMDEADILGDRIAIISQGKLRCCGSSLFLRSRFGSGYYLVLVRKDADTGNSDDGSDLVDSGASGDAKFMNSDLATTLSVQDSAVKRDSTESSEDEGLGSEAVSCVGEVSPGAATNGAAAPPPRSPSPKSEEELTALIQSCLPAAQLAENLGTDISYVLPSSGAKDGSFQRLFQDLDASMDRLGLSSYGISDTTLEEIFLKVAAEGETEAEPGAGDQSLTDNGQIPSPYLGRRSLRRSLSRQSTTSNGSVHATRRLPSESDILLNRSLEGNNAAAAQLNAISEDQPQQPHLLEAGGQGARSQGGHRPMTANDKQGGQPSHSIFGSKHEHPDSPVLLVRYSRNGDITTETIPPPDTTVDGTSHLPQDTEMEVFAESPYAPANSSAARKITGLPLIRRQFLALLIKRWHHTRRSIKGFISQVLLPVFFVCFALVFAMLVPPVEQPPSLALVPWAYSPPEFPDQYVFFSETPSPSDPLSDKMVDTLLYDPGISTRCMVNEPIKDKPCLWDQAGDWTQPPVSDSLAKLFAETNFSQENPSPSCSCSTGSAICPEGAGGLPPPSMLTQTSETMRNMTGRNLTDWLVKTMDDFVQERFGGLKLVDSLSPSEQDADQLPIIDAALGDSTRTALRNVVSAMQRPKGVQVWWNNKAWHALPIYISVANNAKLRSNLDSASLRSKYGFTAYNHPLNYTRSQLFDQAARKASIDLGIAVDVVFALAFVPAGFVLFLIMERTSKSKHLQIVSGINPTVYWLANFFWDIANYLVTALLVILLFVAFQKEAYTSSANLPCLVALLFLYGWAITPLMYPASYLFDVPSTAYVTLACANGMVGVITCTTTFVLDYMENQTPELETVNIILKKVFLIFPHYCLGRGLMDMSINQLFADTLEIFDDDLFRDPLSWDLVGRNLMCLAIEGAIFFTLVLLIQYRFFLTHKTVATKNGPIRDEDIDVARERERVLSGSAIQDLVRLENLTKVYQSPLKKKFVAVDRVCVGIPMGECFGLLGVNGAGKTTTFKMLTGDTDVTSGNAFLDSHSILQEMRKVQQNMGYCPQFDALDSMLTGQENLEFYARLRGIPEDQVKGVADWGIERLGLSQYASKPAGTYSGGNKRKLSTATSLIGDPPVIFLDEPTSGMDPRARRFLWDCITEVIKEGRSVVLTSHSMEECEALCTRIAIMVNGTFSCLGSSQHLKNRFGDGYTVAIRVSSQGVEHPPVEAVVAFVGRFFPGALLKERHYNMVEYQLPSTTTSLATLFKQLEANRERLSIEDYSVNQTTLDQVFINFAKMQKSLDDDLVIQSTLNPPIRQSNVLIDSSGEADVNDSENVYVVDPSAVQYVAATRTTPPGNNLSQPYLYQECSS